ncbi:MAG: aldehyde ferredoxin oxidoreductase C-terminal domain-containing protein, partial [Candidatus Fermentibacteraceae bacterium]
LIAQDLEVEGLWVGDLDGDGENEIVAGPKVFKRTEEGWRRTELISDLDPRTCVAVGDLTGDGRPDVVLSEGERDRGRLVWLRAPDWEPVELAGDLFHPHSLALADFNADGKLDIFVGEMGLGGYESPREIIYRNAGGREAGTVHLAGSMNRSGRLPVMNHRMGSHEDAAGISADAFEGKFDAGMPDDCWLGCTLSCRKGVSGFMPKTGPYKGDEVLVEGPDYRAAAGAANMGVFDPEFVMEYSFYCTTYAIDVISFSASAAFAMECFEEGILDAESTGGMELHFGDADAALDLLHATAGSRGFGRIAGKGIRFMKFYFEEHYGADPAFLDDIGMECRGLEYPQCCTAESPALQAACGAASGGYLQDGDWPLMAGLGEEAGQDPEALAQAVHSSQLWASWFGLAGLCALPWTSMDPERAPERVESYSSLFEAVTGREVSPVDLLKMSERVHNFRRVFDLRMGHGTREEDRVPYRAQGPATESEYESRSDRYDRQLKDEAGIDPAGMSTAERLAALRKHREELYSDLLSALYRLRGWNGKGEPTAGKLIRLGIDFPEVLDVVKPGG